MEKVFKYKFILIIAVSALLLTQCKKNEMNLLDSQIETIDVGEISSATATITGFVVASGDGYSEKGICYNKTGNPTIDDPTVVYDGEDSGAAFKVTLTGLDFATTYYARAYGKNSSGVVYGSDTTFVTNPIPPSVVAVAVTNITDVTASSGGTITNNGGAEITAKGICWSMNENPDFNDNFTENGTGSDAYTSNMTGLRPYTTYYVRAYAINIVDTAYSTQIQFVTAAGAPVVSTVSVAPGATSADVTGNVEHDGGATITERGVCFSTVENPTTADNTVTNAGTIGEFTANISGLTTNTTYHVRAYAINSYGTSYGEDMQFSTFPPELYMTGDGVGQDAENWNWNEPIQLVPVHSHPELFWKIVWMKGSGEFKFAPQAAWSGGDFGKTGNPDAEGVYSIGGDNIPVPATEGYYMVVVDFANSTVQVTDPKVYGIGGAFNDDWTSANSSYLFTVDNNNKVIKYSGFPTDGELRMHVAASTLNCDWWQAEFIVLSGNIEYRGNGNDQTRVNVTAGQNIELNFRDGTGIIAK